MISGFTASPLTIVHVLVSLIGILSGLVVLFRMFSAKRLDGWTWLFMVATLLTSVTGFFFPFHRILPSRALTGGPAPAAITLRTDRVRLRATRLTAAVSGASSGSNFNIGNLPGLFTANGITLIQVQTSSKTNFENASDLSGFVDGTSVSVRGLLFGSIPTPVLIADKVRKR